MSDDRAKSFLQMIHRSQRGRLKIYLGYGPGVGKTCSMLQEAHRLFKDGIDVVVALVETHGRAETMRILEGLEVVPRRATEYRGITVDEMDLDAVLLRKPQVALVDELAHSNIPGSRNTKRYQDIQELLAAGIHVITSLNIQHLESLYNTVETLLSVKVRERIPDSVLSDADEVVNVDLSTEDLQKRLRDGKIYPSNRIESSLSNFFQSGNLEHLRELTMREIASQIDYKRRDVWDEGDKIAPDQIMVCLASKGPNSARLLRTASRLAGRLNRNWYAVYVQTPSEDPALIDAVTQRLLGDTLTLANQLGATVFTFKGQDVVETILNFAKEYRVGHIVIGKPNPIPQWKRRILGKQSVAEHLMLRAENVSVLVVDAAASSELKAQDTSASQNSHHSSIDPFKNLLDTSRIAILDEAIKKDEVIELLVDRILSTRPELDRDQVLASIQNRESKGSTFLNEGIALPHATIDGNRLPYIAIALTKGGISDVASDKKIEAVFLLLDSGDSGHGQLIGKARKAIQKLLIGRDYKIQTAEELLEILGSMD